MNENFDAFDDYVMTYDMNEQMISYKYNHSYRVTHQSEEIARDLNLSEEDKNLSSIIGLLHDIARFRQWTKYKSFTDADTFDHGDEGVKILFDENEIEKYNIDKEDYEIVKKAVKYHNKLSYEQSTLNDRENMHVKIIRDADKIDIIYSFSTNRLLELDEDDSKISEKVSEDFMNHKSITKTDIKNKNDRILMLIGLIYDLNFDYSYDKINKEEYVDKIYGHLKNKEIFKPYIDEIKKYMKGKIKNAR